MRAKNSRSLNNRRVITPGDAGGERDVMGKLPQFPLLCGGMGGFELPEDVRGDLLRRPILQRPELSGRDAEAARDAAQGIASIAPPFRFPADEVAIQSLSRGHIATRHLRIPQTLFAHLQKPLWLLQNHGR